MEVPYNCQKQAAGTGLPCPSYAGQHTEFSILTVLYKMDILDIYLVYICYWDSK